MAQAITKKAVQKKSPVNKSEDQASVVYLSMPSDPNFWKNARHRNRESFKDGVKDQIIKFELSEAKINIEEKLQTCGQVGYITEADVVAVNQPYRMTNEDILYNAMIKTSIIMLMLGAALIIARKARASMVYQEACL